MNLAAGEGKLLEEFVNTVWAADFTEGTITSLLGIRDVPLIRPQDMPSYLWRCGHDNSIRALMVALFLLGQKVRRGQLEQMLGEETVGLLLRLERLAEPEPGVLVCPVDLYPCVGSYVFTDQLLARRYLPDHVYQLGTDSYVLARVTPRMPRESALDLCTGSGIHAILAARHCNSAVGIDLNCRALEYARLNATLNGVGNRCEFLQGDLYAPVSGRRFDLITANPPFVPTPDKSMQRHRTGGESGEEISERLVAGLATHLNPGGLFSMVLDYPVMRDSTYLQRLQSWLGGGQGWGVAVLNFGNVSREHYIREHIGQPTDYQAYEALYLDYLESYARLGILEIGFANVFIVRLSGRQGGWAREHYMVTPHHAQFANVADWLDGLTTYLEPDWEPDWNSWKPCRHRLVADIWRDRRRRRGMVEYADLAWSGPLALTGEQAELALALSGRTTAARLAERWASRHGLSQTEARQQCKAIFRYLGEQLVLA